jgi:hypothetical protein
MLDAGEAVGNIEKPMQKTSSSPLPSQHKLRRQVLQNYFSRQSTNQMTYIIRERLDPHQQPEPD